MRLFNKILLLVLIAFPTVVVHNSNGLVVAQETEEDAVMDEEADVSSEDEDEPVDDTTDTTVVGEDEEETEDDDTLKKSPDADSQILFVKPEDNMNLPAGSVVHVIVGFTNNGKDEFMVDSMDASFRYPQDYNYFIQNFTEVYFDKMVEAKRQSSFEYSFVPSENFNGRPFGLTINLNYHDKEGKSYQDAVFNETVSIIDPIEGFDTETLFMWLTLAALALLILVVVQQAASKRLAPGKSKIETGTQSNGDIDYDWIPKDALEKEKNKARRRARMSSSSSGSGEER